MKAIRNIVKVSNGQILVNLPKDFNYKQVEVIILADTEIAEQKAEIEIKKNNPLNWDEIVGISEFYEDSSNNHDKYIGETI